MSEQASLAAPIEGARHKRTSDGPSVVVPISEMISAATAVAASPVAPSMPTPAAQLRGGRLAMVCALAALIAATVSLAAPTLRPMIADTADGLLGVGNIASRVLTPSPAIEAAWRHAREEAMQVLNAHVAAYEARINRLAAAQQATNADVARAVVTLKSDHAAGDILARAVDRLSEQTRELRSATLTLDGRVRATGLLTLALRLRRDVDAGLPISRDVAALESVGPFPTGMDHALQQLRQISDGTPTMRDLADEFDVLMARMTLRMDAATSWANRGWTRITTLLGGTATTAITGPVERLRGLARDGRFSEAADEIEASPDADLGAGWVAKVRARAAAVVAIQSLLAYSLSAYENAFAAPDDARGKPTP